jgi:hypothetical protein
MKIYKKSYKKIECKDLGIRWNEELLVNRKDISVMENIS